MSMARALHEHIGIPAELLLRGQEITLDDPSSGME